MDTPARYSTTAIALHWLMALALIGLLGVGTWMTGLKTSPDKIAIYNLHKAIGLTVLALAALRLILRVLRRPPPLPAMPAWQAWSARIGHGSLYALMFAMPITGWLQNSAAGFPLTWFGLFKVPALVPRDSADFRFWQSMHEWLAWALMILIAVHVAAAFKHHFIDRDGLLRRMLPARRPRSASVPGETTP
jgi:cytochrome b561